MSYNGFSATITAGDGGFDGSQNYDKIPISNLIEAKNIRFDGDAWRKVGGLTLFNANAVTNAVNILAGIDWNPTQSIQHQVIACADGKVYKEISGDLDANTLATMSAFTSPPVFVECGQEIVGNNRDLVLFTAGQVPQVLQANNATMNAFAVYGNASPVMSLDWSSTNMPTAGVMHDQRLVAWGNPNGPHNLYFSNLNDHTDFSSNYPPIYSIMPGEGEYIAACYSLVSTTRLYIFKYPTGIYYIDTTDVNSFVMPVVTVRRDIGMAGPNAIAKVGGLGTWFIGSDGHVYSLDSLQNPDIDPRDASITAQLNLNEWISDNVAPNRLKWARLMYDTNRKEVWAMYSSSGTTANNLCLVFDVSEPNKVRIATDERGNYWDAAWFAKEATSTFRQLYVAGTGGKVYRANQASRVIGTATAYPSSFRTPDTDFGWMSPKLSEIYKRFDWLEFVFQSTGDYPLYVETYVDGEYNNTYSFDLGAAQAGLDSFVLDTDQLATSGLIRRRVKIGGIGKRFGIRCYNNGASQDFNIARIIVYAAPLGQQGEI